MKQKIKPLLSHQKESLAFMKPRERVFDMSDPGTMKTRVELEDFSRNGSGNKAMLVIAPKSILRPAWGDDAKEFTPHLHVSIAYAENRDDAFAEQADIYVTNTDAVKWLAKQNIIFFDRFERIVVDESSTFKHHTSDRSRALDRVKRYFDIRRAMTGTPNSNTICDVWNQAYFLDDGKRLGGSFFKFRAACCVPEQVGPRKEMVKWTDKPGAEDAVAAQLADITIRHRFDECIDIPPTHTYVVKYYPSKKQERAYESMRKDAIALMKKGMVTAINKAAARTKLLQISSGAVYESEEKYHVIDLGRYELVMDLCEPRAHSIVFYLWKHQRDELVRQAKTRGYSYCVFDGDASTKQRNEMKDNFQAGFFKVMFAHPKSAAHGLTLTRAVATIWPSPPDDLEWWVQGNRRHARGGQTHKTEIIVVLAQETLEPGIYRNLEIKNARMDNLLDLLHAL